MANPFPAPRRNTPHLQAVRVAHTEKLDQRQAKHAAAAVARRDMHLDRIDAQAQATFVRQNAPRKEGL